MEAKHNFRALLVEDDTATQMILRRMLENLGFQVDAVGDGDAALDYLRKNNNIQLLITDHFLPTINGMEIVGLIKRHSILRRIPCVLVSADSKSRPHAHRLRFSAWIAKPVKKNVLETILFHPHMVDQMNAAS